MSIYKDLINNLKEKTNFDYEYEFDQLVFYQDLVLKRLSNNKPLRKAEKELVELAFSIIRTIRMN